MPLPPGHAAQTLAVPRRLTRREKRLIGGVLAVVAVLAVGLVISFATATKKSAGGCIYVTIPAATGAEQINDCGAAARSICTSAGVPGAFPRSSADAIAAECRKAGLPASAAR